MFFFSSQDTGSQESILELDLDREDIEALDNTSDESRRRNSVSPMPQIRCSTEHHQVFIANLKTTVLSECRTVFAFSFIYF
jgi:hypothetical protein